jgi:hypothetical protein
MGHGNPNNNLETLCSILINNVEIIIINIIIIIIIIILILILLLIIIIRLNTAKTRVMPYSRKTTVLSYEYRLCHAAITRTSGIKGLGVFFDTKLLFHNYVDFIFSEYTSY